MAPRPRHINPRLLLTTLLSFFTLFPKVAGYIHQHIIDDSDSSIQYSPNGWSTGKSCAICSGGLDLSQIHGRTWTNGSTLRGSGEIPVFFTFSFTGDYLEIVFIAQAIPPISNSTEGVLNDANATITVDGKSVSYSQQLVQGSDKNQLVGYNRSLHAQSWTTNSKHDVRVDLAPLGSTLSLDYIAYSVAAEDEDSPKVSSSDGVSPTAEVEMASGDTSERGEVIAIGVATGGSAFVALVAFFAWWYMRLRRKRVAQNTLQPIHYIINIAPSEPPSTSRTREKLPFRSDTSLTLPPIPTTPSSTMSSQWARTFSSPTSQPHRPLSTAASGSRQSGAGPIQGILHLDNQVTPMTVVPLPPPRSGLGDLDMDDVPPPAYSPPPSIE